MSASVGASSTVLASAAAPSEVTGPSNDSAVNSTSSPQVSQSPDSDDTKTQFTLPVRPNSTTFIMILSARIAASVFSHNHRLSPFFSLYL